MIVYDAGYGQHNRATTLAARAEALNAIVIDTRLKPSSWRPEWRKAALRELLGERYQWWGDVWGNRNYHVKETCAVDIVDLHAGIRRLRAVALERQFDAVILLCGCRKVNVCHRGVISAYLAKVGWRTAALEWQPGEASVVLSEPQLTLI